MHRCATLLVGTLLMVVPLAAAEPAASPSTTPDPVTFESGVRRIFKAHCFHCHGEQAETEGGLDLRLVRLAQRGGESGPALVPGDAEASLLVARIVAGEMPPGETKLTAEQIATIRLWIDQGARTTHPEPAHADQALFTPEERAFWAFQPIGSPAVPEVAQPQLVRSPIDAFLLARLESEGLSFSPQADARELVRRAYFDLWGLPPTPEQLDAFLTDTRPDAWERLIDRLLASPHYGERWGRHWLDIAGYADSDGYGDKDLERPLAYRYRDYVIRSFNSDKPFDVFIQEQLAGDELVGTSSYGRFLPQDADRLIATGFLRMAPDGTGDPQADQLAARHDVLAETLKIVSTSLLGLSVGCAQCHDHRFDPISQQDYHRLRAILEPAYDPSHWRTPDQRVISVLTEADWRQQAEVDTRLADLAREREREIQRRIEALLETRLAELPEAVRDQVSAAARQAVLERLVGSEPTPDQRALFARYPRLKLSESDVRRADPPRYAAELKEYESRVAAIQATGPAALKVAALTEVPGKLPPSHLFRRGDFRQPGQRVSPGELSILAGDDQRVIPSDDPSRPTSGRRLAYARHLTNGRHPLTARVLVNRFWMHHFGRGIVATPADFGVQGERPTHPELLDWLARDFQRGGWSLKAFHRRVMNSTAYRQSSRRTEHLDRVDPENRWLARAGMRRLEAEEFRDALLAVAGTWNRTMFGPPLPVAPDGVGQVVIGRPAGGRDGRVNRLKHNQENRRSVYVQVRRSLPLALLETFDAPVLTPNCEARTSSTAAQQALLMMNNDVVLSQVRQFAERVAREAGEDPDRRIERAWRLALSTTPSPHQLARARRFLDEQRDRFAASTQAGQADVDLLALTTFCQFLVSSNAFLYVD